jgi:hypothetical protein
LFFLLIGIQLLIIGALVHDHQEERDRKAQTSAENEDHKEAGTSVANISEEQRKKL